MCKPSPAVTCDEDETLVDLGKAYVEALLVIADLWKVAEAKGRDPRAMVLELKDESGEVLLSVPFTDYEASRARN